VVDFDEFDKMEYADNYFNLKFSLEDLFQRNVDLLENKVSYNRGSHFKKRKRD